MGKLHGVPELPPHYLLREADLAGLKQKLLASGANMGITSQSSAVGVCGMGGTGKSVLAAALAHDSEVRQAFPDGIYWLRPPFGRGTVHVTVDLSFNSILPESFGQCQHALFMGRRIVAVTDENSWRLRGHFNPRTFYRI
jgi:NB-ARC domain